MHHPTRCCQQELTLDGSAVRQMPRGQISNTDGSELAHKPFEGAYVLSFIQLAEGYMSPDQARFFAEGLPGTFFETAVFT